MGVALHLEHTWWPGGQGRVRGERSSTWSSQCKGPWGVSALPMGLLLPKPCTLQTFPQGISSNSPPKQMHTFYLYFRGQETEINLLACLWSISWSAARSGFELSMFESRIWNFHIQLFSLSLEINPTHLSCVHIFWLPVSCKAFYTDRRKILPMLRQSTC